jgi:hypothetical protein
MYKFSCKRRFSFLLGIYLRMELVSHIVTLCLSPEGRPDCFQRGYTILHLHEWYKDLISQRPHHYLFLSIALFNRFYMCVKGDLTVL